MIRKRTITCMYSHWVVFLIPLIYHRPHAALWSWRKYCKFPMKPNRDVLRKWKKEHREKFLISVFVRCCYLWSDFTQNKRLLQNWCYTANLWIEHFQGVGIFCPQTTPSLLSLVLSNCCDPTHHFSQLVCPGHVHSLNLPRKHHYVRSPQFQRAGRQVTNAAGSPRH